MSASVWNASLDPFEMLALLRQGRDKRRLLARPLKRKLRLFVVAICRLLHQSIPEMQAQIDDLLQLAVRHADGLASLGDLRRAHDQTEEELDLSNLGFFQSPIELLEEVIADSAWLEGWAATELAVYSISPDIWDEAEWAIKVMVELPVRCAAKSLHLANRAAGVEDGERDGLEERLTAIVRPDVEPPAHARVCGWLREIFGDPFQTIAFDPGRLPTTALGLASRIYEQQAFDQLPLLADALQEAGCKDEHILGHCRAAGPHTRGCWAVDLVLGKS